MYPSNHLFVTSFILLYIGIGATVTRYEPNWKSLDTRPMPKWYDEGKIGIFIHWGVFSVPAYGGAWFWWYWKSKRLLPYVEFMKENYRPDFTYPDFASQFRAEFYNPNQWADIIKDSGASYVVLVSKHHEGFTNWPSKYSWNWNAGDVGPNKDLVGDLANAIKSRTNVKFGVYHSMFEWYHPLFLQDQANGFRSQKFVKEKSMPELYELVNRYKPDVIWSDGDWMAGDKYWNSTEFIAWLYNDSPVKDTVVVNDRWGNNTWCKHGDFWDCHDRYRPGKLLHHKWENCFTLDKHAWAFRANAKLKDFLTIEEVLQQLVSTVSLGGNVLINVGPTSSGMINPIMAERLEQLGSWLKVNGEAIYGTHVWSHQNDSLTKDAWYTSKAGNGTGNIVYAILLSWPTSGELPLGFPQVGPTTTVSMVGLSGSNLSVSVRSGSQGGIVVFLPRVPISKLPCEWAWVLKMEGLKNQETLLDRSAFAEKVESIRMEKNL